jgi:isoquinoline 1-oxidoreductase beta subunit
MLKPNKMNDIQIITRRSFIRGLGLASGGLIIACNFPESGEMVSKLKPFNGKTFDPNLFIQLKKSGELILLASRSEMGNGVRTSLTSVIADEMDADWNMVTVKQATGDAKFLDQNTDGSRSIRYLFEPMRKMGATARAMLIAAAAIKWKVEASGLKTDNHYVVNPANGDKLFYGDLIEEAAGITIPENPPLKDYKDFKYIGKGLKSIDGANFTSGKAIYGMDIKLENMKYAAIARCPVTFGTVKSYNKDEAIKVTGVSDVIELPRIAKPFGSLGGVAVVADNTWAALKAKETLDVEWDNGANEVYTSESYAKELVKSAKNKGKEIRNDGNINSAFKNADQIIESTYELPHLVHAPMETPNATAWVHDGICEVWAPVQAPQTTRKEVADLLEIDLENVTINVTLLGGAFGRKSKPDFVLEAVSLSKTIGVPVQVIWSREDDIHHSYYHAASAQYMKASLDSEGKVTGWLHRVAYPSITSTFAPDTGFGAGFEFGQGLTNIPYQIENVRCENGKAMAHVRIGWLRSVYNIIQGFSVNVFVDELAAKAGKDALQFRLDLIGPDRVEESDSGYHFNSAKLKHVLKTAAKNAGYGKKLPKGHGIGLAVHYSFLSYVASTVEVSVKDGKLKVHNIHSVIDCGTPVNLDTIESQMQGAAMFGLSLAYFGKITAKDGAIEQSNFHDYQMLRIADAPKVSVEIVKNTDKPTGVGEPGVPVIAPALINAIYNATGKRYYKLPLMDEGLV